MKDEIKGRRKKEQQTFKEYINSWSEAHGGSTLSSRNVYYYWLRIAYWVAVKLDHLGCTANQASYLGVLFAGLTIPVYLFWIPLVQASGNVILPGILVFILVIICGLMDNIDGALARMQCKKTKTGASHDLIADRLGDILLIIGPIIAGMAHIAIGLTALFSITLYELYRSFHMSIGVKMIKSLVERQWRITIQAIYIAFFSFAIVLWAGLGISVEPLTQSSENILNFNNMFFLLSGLSITSLIYAVVKVNQYDRGKSILNVD
ncbi:MAG: CDP-alcohol phosphatidyltransferase family protein [Candidatus Helarchaeota archaeon]